MIENTNISIIPEMAVDVDEVSSDQEAPSSTHTINRVLSGIGP
jgi:hypothetical protein